MPAFTGAIVPFLLRITPAGLSSDITAGTTVPLGISEQSPDLAGPVTIIGSVPAPAPTLHMPGFNEENFGALLFERIIISPSTKALGFVLSATRFALEIWNTFRTASKVLTAINITGNGGLTLDAPVTLPHSLQSMGSVIYEASLPNSGSPAISEIVEFVVTGISGAVALVTGQRIMVFSVRPDWAAGISERISDFTDVMKSYSNKEQRRGLRTVSRRGLKFQADAMNARDAAGMESLVFGWQDRPYGVPFWQDYSPLTAPAVTGDTSLALDTADRLFAPGGLLLLLGDEFNFESLSILSVSPTAIVVESPLVFNWPKGTLVMPVFLARLKEETSVTRLNSAIDQMDLEFEGEAGQLAGVATVALRQYRGFDVLEAPPNRESDLPRGYKRDLVKLDQQTGIITVESKSNAPTVTLNHPWFLMGRHDITKCRSFLLRRQGQLNPFWVPTWDHDLVMNQDLAPGGTQLVIKRVFYTRFFFPELSRRYLAFIGPGGVMLGYNKVTASQENSNETETLTLETAISAGLAATTTMVSFLSFARLAMDDNSIEWSNPSLAQAALAVQELPQEVPA